jgi:predicted PurR-regulated permease PerM
MNERESKQSAALIASDWGSPLHVRALVLMVVTAAAVYLCYLLTRPFLPAFAGALALAVLFGPLHRWVESHVRQPNLAATISVLAILIIVVVPAIFVAERILGEAASAATTMKAMVETGEWRRIFLDQPRLAPVGRWIEQYFDVPGAVQTVASWLADVATSFVRGSVVQLTGAVLIFYILFYFLRDQRAALERLRSVAPLSSADMDQLYGDVFDTVHATVYGTLAVAAVQGTLGGLMFWWLGLPEPMLWGVVMGLLAVVPVLGAFIIWIPAAAFLALAGSMGKALVLTLWGAIVVGGIDNLLYPMLVGRRLKMHSMVAFVAILGGLIVLGPSGVILGPVAFTVTRVLLQIWHRRNTAAGA